MLDATTGLIYVGNGQYFDPETGRFLTRGNQRNEATNPYVPWKGDPTQALVSPLLLLALLYTRRKNRNKFDTLLVVLVLLSAVRLSLSAYTPVQAEALPVNSGGGADAPSMPMGYASAAEAVEFLGTNGIGLNLSAPDLHRKSGIKLLSIQLMRKTPPYLGVKNEKPQHIRVFLVGGTGLEPATTSV